MRDNSNLFITEREVQLLNSWTTEIIELVAQQKVLYFAIDNEKNIQDDLYGETTKKIFRDPIEIYSRVMLSEHTVKVDEMGIDNIYEIEVYFQRDRVIQDLGFYPRIGDFIGWSNKFFEIKSTTEPQMFGGLSQHRVGIICKAIISRQEVFTSSKNRPYDQTIIPDSELRTK